MTVRRCLLRNARCVEPSLRGVLPLLLSALLPPSALATRARRARGAAAEKKEEEEQEEEEEEQEKGEGMGLST